MKSNLRKLSSYSIAILVAIAAMQLGAPAHAQVSAADKETARSLMNEGDRLYASHDYQAALKAYSGAHALMGVPTTGIEVAKAQEALGMLVEARDTLLQITRQPQKADEPKAFTRARQQATERAAQIATRIPSILTSVRGLSDSASPTVTIDDIPIPPAALSLPRKVNPGRHIIVASAPGYSDTKTEITVRESENAQAELALKKTGPAVASPTPKPATIPTPSSAPAPSTPPPHQNANTLAYVGFGIGAAGILAGSITGILAFSKASDVKSNCPANQCDPKYQSDIDSSKTMGTISTVSFALGAVGAGIGILAILPESSKKERPQPSALQVSPTLGLGSIGLHGEF